MENPDTVRMYHEGGKGSRSARAGGGVGEGQEAKHGNCLASQRQAAFIPPPPFVYPLELGPTTNFEDQPILQFRL